MNIYKLMNLFYFDKIENCWHIQHRPLFELNKLKAAIKFPTLIFLLYAI